MNLKKHIFGPFCKKSLKRDFFSRKIRVCHFSLHYTLTLCKKWKNSGQTNKHTDKQTNGYTTRQIDSRMEGILQDLNFLVPKSVFSLLFIVCNNQFSTIPIPPRKTLLPRNSLATPPKQNIFQPLAPSRHVSNSLNVYISSILNGSLTTQTLRETCPNTEFFLVHIFLYSD